MLNFLNDIAKVLFREGRLDSWQFSPTNFDIFLRFPNFLQSLTH